MINNLKKIILLLAFVFIFAGIGSSPEAADEANAAAVPKIGAKKKASKKEKGTQTSVKAKKPKAKPAAPSESEISTVDKGKIRATQSETKNKNEEEIVTSFGKKTRIDFEDLLIEGQTKKADTVYLFERTESKINSLIKVRKDFRREIMESYLE